MGVTQRLISKELYEKARKALSVIGGEGRVAIRLMAIISARDNGVNLVARIFCITANTLRNWVKQFQKYGIEGLNYKEGRGRKCGVKEEQWSIIKEQLEKDSNTTIKQMVEILREGFQIQTSKSAVHRIMKKLGMSYITARPVHHKQKPEQHEEFKKKSKDKKRRRA